MRPIDADILIEKWNELSIRGRTEFDQVIMSMPTAFDVDKVIKELEKRRKEYEDIANNIDMPYPNECYHRGIMRGYQYSKEIVEQSFEQS